MPFKGNIPWNKGLTIKDPRVKKYVIGGAKTQFKKGYIPPTKKGEIRACIICGKEKFCKPSYLKKGYGKYCSLKCLGRARKGKTNILKDKKFPHRGENYKFWKGDKVSNEGLHQWVARYLGKPKMCEICGSINEKKYEWSNKDHKYRRNLFDWQRLCHKCHEHYDVKFNHKRYGSRKCRNSIL